MGFFDKLLAGGGVAAAGLWARKLYLDERETQRRRASPLTFDEGVTQADFDWMAQEAAKRTPRISSVATAGMAATISVRSNSGLTSWEAEIDFNDYGRLTGQYWISTSNPKSLVPQHFAEAVGAQIVNVRIAQD